MATIKPECVRPGCTNRGVRRGRLCSVCFRNDTVREAFKPAPSAPRCRFCEALLSEVKHRRDVCTMRRCQTELAQERVAKQKRGPTTSRPPDGLTLRVAGVYHHGWGSETNLAGVSD